MKLNRSQLDQALASLTKANNRAYIARSKIMAHCEAAYGFHPGDVDNDQFIDSCDSGCGMGVGMTAIEFEASMLECIRRGATK